MNKRTVTNQDIRDYTLEVIRQMNVDLWTPEIVLGFSRGGLVPANFISQWYDIPMFCINKGVHFNCNLDTYNHVLVIDDINDTGNTLQYFKEKYGVNQGFKYASLIDNAGSIFETDYAGHYINKLEVPDWIVFPWESWWT